jgi:hypothetical protein
MWKNKHNLNSLGDMLLVRQIELVIGCFNNTVKSQSQSHIASDGQSINESWCRTHLGFMTRYLLPFTCYGLVLWGTFSDERRGLSFVYAADPHQRSLSRVRVPWDSLPYFTASELRIPFRRLLRLAGSVWRYSNPPPYWLDCNTVIAAASRYINPFRT